MSLVIKSPKKVKTSGFTLIELLVTISIIAILSAIGLVAYYSVLRTGRDSKRQSDLRTIQSALEQYYSDQGYYPRFAGGPSGICGVCSSNGNLCGFLLWTAQSPNCSLKDPNQQKTYLNEPPNDPISTASNPIHYCYVGIPSGCDAHDSPLKCSSYELYANLESPPSGSSSYTCANGSGSFNFKVTPP